MGRHYRQMIRAIAIEECEAAIWGVLDAARFWDIEEIAVPETSGTGILSLEG